MEVRVYLSFELFSQSKHTYCRKIDDFDAETDSGFIYRAMKKLYGSGCIVVFVMV